MSLGDDLALRKLVLDLDYPPPSPNALDDEFDGDTLDTGKWTWLDQGGTTAAVTDGQLQLTLNENSNRFRGIYQTAPSGSWAFAAKVFIPHLVSGSTSGAWLMAGESTTGEIRAVGLLNLIVQQTARFTTPSSAVAAWVTGLTIAQGQPNPFIYARLDWDGADLAASWSLEGKRWVRDAVVTPAYTPAIVGLGITNQRNVEGVFRFGWFRRLL